MTRRIPILAEAVLVGAISAGVARVVLSDWFLVCCRPFIAGWPGALFSPGVIFGLFIGGGAG